MTTKQSPIKLPTGNLFTPTGLDDLILFIPQTDKEKKGLYSLLEKYTREFAGEEAVEKDLDPYNVFSWGEEGYPYAVFGLKRGKEIVGMSSIEVVKITDIINGKRARERGLDTSKLRGEQVGMLFYMASPIYNSKPNKRILTKVCSAGDQITRAMANPDTYLGTFTEARELETGAAERAGYGAYIPPEFYEAPSRMGKGTTTDLSLMISGDRLLTNDIKMQESALFAAMQRIYYRQNITEYFNKARSFLNISQQKLK